MTHQSLVTATLVLFSAVLCASLSPRVEGDEIEKLVNDAARRHIAKDTCETVSVIVDINGEIICESTFGSAATGEAKEPGTHRIGSLLPQFISIAALKLVESGKLTLDDEIAKHLPSLELAEGVQVRHLLTHSSGLPDFSGFLGKGKSAIRTEQVIEWLQDKTLEFDPNHCAAFSLTNVALAGAIVEKVAGVSVSEYLEAQVFTPTEMASTLWCEDELTGGLDKPTWQDFSGGTIESADLAKLFAADALSSTALDLRRLQVALLSGELLTAKSLQFFSSSRELADGWSSNVAGGATATRLGTIDGFGFGGTIGNFSTSLAHYPAFQLSIVVLAVGGTDELGELERSVARAVMDVQDPQVRDLPLTPDEKQVYLGRYYLGCNEVRIEDLGVGNRLHASWPDSYEFELLYQGRNVFVSSLDDDVRLVFEVDDGRAISFALHEHGLISQAQRLE